MRELLHTLVLLTVTMSSAGCAESHPGEPDAATRMDPEEEEVRAHIDALVRARCERTIRCEARLSSPPWLEAASCHPGSTGANIGQGRQSAWLDGRTTFHADLASDCLAVIEGSCTALESESVCQQVFEGVGGVGADCSRVDCDAATHCPTITIAEPPGACASAERRCVPRPAEGAACRGPCLGDLPCIDGICRPATPEGEPCVGTSECGYRASCRDGVCTPDFVHVGRGGRCSTSRNCEDGLVCAHPIPDEPGFCEDGVPLGNECSRDILCSPWHRCTDGTCQAIALPGLPCDGDVCAYGFWCEEGVCAALPILGESCSEAPACATGLCEDGTCQAVPQGAPCEHPDPAILGSCEFQGCDPELGVCPTYVGEGEYCNGSELRCQAIGLGEVLTCEMDGMTGGTCERPFPSCE